MSAISTTVDDVHEIISRVMNTYPVAGQGLRNKLVFFVAKNNELTQLRVIVQQSFSFTPEKGREELLAAVASCYEEVVTDPKVDRERVSYRRAQLVYDYLTRCGLIGADIPIEEEGENLPIRIQEAGFVDDFVTILNYEPALKAVYTTTNVHVVGLHDERLCITDFVTEYPWIGHIDHAMRRLSNDLKGDSYYRAGIRHAVSGSIAVFSTPTRLMREAVERIKALKKELESVPSNEVLPWIFGKVDKLEKELDLWNSSGTIVSTDAAELVFLASYEHRSGLIDDTVNEAYINKMGDLNYVLIMHGEDRAKRSGTNH